MTEIQEMNIETLR